MKLSIKSRTLQFVLALVLLVISAILLKNNKSLEDTIEDLEVIYKALNSTGILDLQKDVNFTLSSKNAGSILGLVASAMTVTSHTGLISLNTIQRYQKGGPSFTLRDSKSIIGKLGLSQTGYLTSLSGTEVGSLGVWFSTFIVQTAENGNWNCDDIESLLYQYDINGNSVLDYMLENFYLQLDSSNSKQLPANWSSVEAFQKQSQMLLKLSNNCKIKKASIAISCLGLISYVLTGSLVGFSAMKLFSSFKALIDEHEDKITKLPHFLVYTDPLLFPTIEIDDDMMSFPSIHDDL